MTTDELSAATTTRLARVPLPEDIHSALAHVAIDARTTMAGLLVEGARLVLAQHRGHGLSNTINNPTTNA